MAVRAGQAFIVIGPSFRGFKTKTETWVKTNMKAVDIQVNPVLSKKPIVTRPQKPVKVPVDVDRSRFDRSIAAIESRLDRLTRGRFLINVGIALSPIAAPALAAAVGGGIAGGGIAAAGLAGIVGMATVGAASLKRVTAAQEQVTTATAASTAAVKTLQGARQSLASAERSAAATRIAAARSVANAERGVADAQAKLADSQLNVRRGLRDLHEARRQAVLDLQDLQDKTADNALSQESAEIGLLEAQQELARVQGDAKATDLDRRKAALGLAEAQDRLNDANKTAAKDAADLAKAQKDTFQDSNPDVIAARKALEDAEKDRDAAQQGVRDARRQLSEARADASRQIADSNAAVAAAGAEVAAAQATAADAQAAQAKALAAMSPAQKAAAAGMDRLKSTWSAFQDVTDPFVLPALVAGMDALGKGLSPLAAFMEPVSAAAGRMFSAFGDALGSKGFLAWSTSFGEFSASIAGDATQGILNLARGFGSLMTAFMPLSKDMSGGLVTLTARFAEWTAGLQGSSGFNGFVDYVRENGPLLISTLGEVGLAIIAIGKAAAPLGHQLLEIITSVSRFIVVFAAAHPQITAGVVGFVALSSGVSAAAGPLSKMIPLVKTAGGGVLGLAKATGTAFTFGKDFAGGLINQRNALKTGASWATTFGSATRQGATNTVLAARATGSFVIQQGALGLAYARNLIASALITAGMIAQRVATVAVTAATRAWAAGQWLLNAALTANPIGLVIVGLVAFGALVVTLYKKVGWFRAGVDAMWSGLQTGFFWVRDNWKLLAVLLTGPIGGAVVLITNNFDKIKTGLTKVKDAFTTAKDGISSVWSAVSDAVTNPLDTIKKALNVFFKGIDKIAEFFGLNFDFRFEVGDDEKKPKKVPSGDDHRKPSVKAATGGVLPGWSPGRDIHTFMSPTGGKLELSGGEAVMRPEWTAAVGGPKAVSAMNKAAIRGGQAFADGGVFWPTKNKHWTTYSGHDGLDFNGAGNGLGAPYFAAKSGTIAYTGTARGYGNAVFLATDGGPTLTYGHSSRVDVRQGQRVTAGKQMGLIGYSGNVRPAGPRGSHLHFGLVGEGPDEGAAALAFLGGAAMPSGGGGGGGGFDPIGAVKKAVLEAKELSESISAGPFGNMLKKAPGTVGGLAVDWAKKKLNPLDDIKDGLDKVFDNGGIASTRGLLVKDTIRPERVLSPSQTAALEDGFRNLRPGEGGVQELTGQVEILNVAEIVSGVATKAVGDANFQTRRGLRTPRR